MSSNTSRGQQGNSKGTSKMVLALIAASFLVFVAGGFVFAYLFLFSASSEAYPEILPKWGGVSFAPSASASSNDRGASGTAETPDRRRVNILLLGLDQRDDERGVPTRSDSIIVVSIDPVGRRAAMISFPRDMWVQIPGYADNRINVPNFLGDAYKYPGGGPALAKKTVEANFGLRIDYYARINFRGFEKIVDTLGGVDVDVERAIRDDEYPTEDYETMSIYIPAGRQHMNGKVALQYARSRHSENDFGRAKRQQRLLVAIKDRALQLNVIPKLPSLMGTMKDMVETDIPAAEILRLAKMSTEIGADSIGSLVIDASLAHPFVGEGGADLLMPNKPEIRKSIAALLADPVVQSEAARIEVVNGTAKSGLATKTGDYLLDQGFNVTKVSTADRSDYKSIQILVMGDKKGTANLLAETLKAGQQAVVAAPASTSAPSGATPTKVDQAPDIKIILGADYDLPQ
ncbi:MAG: LCP family protein [Chloroflexota bacterium]